MEIGGPFRAILFDCNGIIADDEPLHLELFQKVLKEEGIRLTRKQYFDKYLALDDRTCFRDALRAHGQAAGEGRVRALIRRKAGYYLDAARGRLRIFPGVRAFVRAHRSDFGLAVVSGALRHEVELILERAGVRRDFAVIVSSGDTRMGKPDPQCFRLGLARLNLQSRFREEPLRAGECVAIEDSVHGVQAAQKAGMKCVAVTNSYSARELAHADWVVESLAGLRVRRSGSG